MLFGTVARALQAESFTFPPDINDSFAIHMTFLLLHFAVFSACFLLWVLAKLCRKPYISSEHDNNILSHKNHKFFNNFLNLPNSHPYVIARNQKYSVVSRYIKKFTILVQNSKFLAYIYDLIFNIFYKLVIKTIKKIWSHYLYCNLATFLLWVIGLLVLVGIYFSLVQEKLNVSHIMNFPYEIDPKTLLWSKTKDIDPAVVEYDREWSENLIKWTDFWDYSATAIPTEPEMFRSFDPKHKIPDYYYLNSSTSKVGAVAGDYEHSRFSEMDGYFAWVFWEKRPTTNEHNLVLEYDFMFTKIDEALYDDGTGLQQEYIQNSWRGKKIGFRDDEDVSLKDNKEKYWYTTEDGETMNLYDVRNGGVEDWFDNYFYERGMERVEKEEPLRPFSPNWSLEEVRELSLERRAEYIKYNREYRQKAALAAAKAKYKALEEFYLFTQDQTKKPSLLAEYAKQAKIAKPYQSIEEENIIEDLKTYKAYPLWLKQSIAERQFSSYHIHTPINLTKIEWITDPISDAINYRPFSHTPLPKEKQVDVSEWLEWILRIIEEAYENLIRWSWYYHNPTDIYMVKPFDAVQDTAEEAELELFLIDYLNKEAPTMFENGYGNWISLTMVVYFIVALWWNCFFNNKTLAKEIDFDNPNNLLTGPNRVFLSEEQRDLIERDESKRYQELMDDVLARWRLLNIPEDSDQTLQFLLDQSEQAFILARREIAEKHWLPYSASLDSEGNPESFTKRARGLDEAFLLECIEAERTSNNNLYVIHYTEWSNAYKNELKLFMEHATNKKYSVRYILGIIKIKYKYEINYTKPKYETKWHDLGREMLEEEDTTDFKY